MSFDPKTGKGVTVKQGILKNGQVVADTKTADKKKKERAKKYHLKANF